MMPSEEKKEIYKAFNKLPVFAIFFLFLFGIGSYTIYKMVLLIEENLIRTIIIVAVILFILFIIWYTISALVKYEFINKNQKKDLDKYKNL